jgi:hypothetical protein
MLIYLLGSKKVGGVMKRTKILILALFAIGFSAYAQNSKKNEFYFEVSNISGIDFVYQRNIGPFDVAIKPGIIDELVSYAANHYWGIYPDISFGINALNYKHLAVKLNILAGYLLPFSKESTIGILSPSNEPNSYYYDQTFITAIYPTLHFFAGQFDFQIGSGIQYNDFLRYSVFNNLGSFQQVDYGFFPAFKVGIGYQF